MTERLGYSFYVEVTGAACIATAEGKVLGDNLVDTTLGFSVSMPMPPGPVPSDERMNKVLAHNVSPIVASIQAVLMQLGFATSGVAVEERLVDHARQVGEGMSSPVTVTLVPEAPGGKARA